MTLTGQFDNRYTNNDLQKLKIFLSLLDSPLTGVLSIYIKWKELEYAIYEKQNQQYPTRDANERNILQTLTELLPYCSKEESAQIEQIKNALETAESMKDTMETIRMMQEMMNENTQDNMNETTTDTIDPNTIMDLINLINTNSK